MFVFTEPIAQKPALPAAAEGLGQRRDLDRIAQRRARAVRLDVGDGLRLDAGHRLRHRDHLGLAVDARARYSRPCSEPSLLMADPLITAWIVSPSASASASRFSTTTPTPLPHTVPAASRVEGPAVPVGRERSRPPGRGSPPSAER